VYLSFIAFFQYKEEEDPQSITHMPLIKSRHLINFKFTPIHFNKAASAAQPSTY